MSDDFKPEVQSYPAPVQWRTTTVGFAQDGQPDQVEFYVRLSIFTPIGEHVTYWKQEWIDILIGGLSEQGRITGEAQAEWAEGLAMRTAAQVLGERGGGGA